MTEITNIVPIQPNPESDGQPDEQVNITVEPVDNDTYCRRLAEDAIDFLEVEFKEQVTCKEIFWGFIHQEAARRLGTVNEPIETEVVPYPEDVAKNFANELIPWGKYSGQKVQTVFCKDAEALRRLATNPLLFQLRLRRFLASDLKNVIKPVRSRAAKKQK